jgi:hypothetical protein
MGEMPPSGTYYRRPVNPAGRATRWTLLCGAVLTITVLVGIGTHQNRAEPTRAAGPYAAKPVPTTYLVEQAEPLQNLRPMRAVVRKERRRPSPVVPRRSRPVVRADHAGPKPRHTAQVKAVKKPATAVSALCARQFPDDVRLRNACVLYLS